MNEHVHPEIAARLHRYWPAPAPLPERLHAEGLEPHLYYASCPTAEAPHQRCVRCPVCAALATLEI